jgi:hypothetical protein
MQRGQMLGFVPPCAPLVLPVRIISGEALAASGS